MSNRNLNLPEPILPEHALIRDAAPVPEFSAGFKTRVMADCRSSITRASRIWRWKVAGCVTAVCSLGIVACLAIPDAPDPAPQITNQPAVPATPSHSLGFPSPSNRMSVDMPTPANNRDPEKSQMNQIMETLKNRQLDANMLRGL